MNKVHDLTIAYVESHPGDAARVLERLPADATAAFLASIPVRIAAPLAGQMLPPLAARCLEELDDDAVVGILRALGPQRGSLIMRYLPELRRLAVISLLPTALAIVYQLLLGYPEDSVGAWMDPAAPSASPSTTAGEALERIRRSPAGEAAELSVVGSDQRLVGVLSVAALVRAGKDVPVSQIMRPADHMLPARASLGMVQAHEGWIESRALPVVERNERFVGVLRYGTLLQAIRPQGGPARVAGDGGIVETIGELVWSMFSGLIQAVISLLPAGARTSAASPSARKETQGGRS